MSGQHRVLPAYRSLSPDDVWDYLQSWVLDLASLVGVDTSSSQLQVVDVTMAGTLAYFELPALIGSAKGRRFELSARVRPDGTTRRFRVNLVDADRGSPWRWHLDEDHDELGLAHEHHGTGPGSAASTIALDLDAVRHLAITEVLRLRS